MTRHFASRVTNDKMNVKTMHNNQRSTFGTARDVTMLTSR